MIIKDIFSKDLFRQINGVVKADQQDESVIWQELDEYVITKELDRHFRKFFDSYLAAIDNPQDPAVTDRMGVWVSGFFGSGKSHFIKMLSCLLANRSVNDPVSGQGKQAADFFDSKINDSMLLADVKRGVASNTDVILFNIDSKADNKEGRDAILQVFMKVFNEMQGFCGDSPHIADMERYLVSKGLFDQFQQAFKEVSGEDWLKERDAYLLMRDEVVQALSKALGKSLEAAAEWFDKAEDSYKLSIEKLAAQVKEYLDSKDNNHRIIFLVDEIGQFIGSDTHLMLSLQTITEDLGRVCNGRAWVIVTSQEDIDAVLGEVRSAKAQDFSKIQGRFNTRLSLSSSNTDEVIQRRLLSKTDDAKHALEDLFSEKGEILKNQISFSGGATMRNYRDKDDFIDNYPFAPYHFQLIQKVFESIRKAGATGLHLSRGERSMLDAFQSAAKVMSEKSIGALIPVYDFYPAIESFLDTSVKRTIDQAQENAGLEPFDVSLLRSLFLIRYVDIIKPNIDNLVTLCIDEIDADRLMLRRKIEESLHRLEKETLINRSGDLYFFLTNEERDVSREIKNVDIPASKEVELLSELIFDDVLKNDNKHRYQLNKKDYGYNRLCDGSIYGSRAEQQLTVEIISPLHDDYSLFSDARCIPHSTESGGKVLFKLEDNKDLKLDLRSWLQTDKYVRLKHDATATPTLTKILSERAEENRERRGRLTALLERLLLESDCYAIGKSMDIKAATPRTAVAELLNYLITNIYTKLGHIKGLHDEPQKEIRAVLMTDDIGQVKLPMEGTEGNTQALKEVKQFVDLSASQSHKILLDDLIERFEKRPYGWPEWEIVLLVARLFIGGELTLKVGTSITPREAIDYLTKSVKWKQVTIIKRKNTGAEDLKKARDTGHNLFGEIGPETEDGLYAFLHEHLNEWDQNLKSYRSLAETGRYPGRREIEEGCQRLYQILSIVDSYEFFQTFNKDKEDLEDLAEDIHELIDFYSSQRGTWEKLREMHDLFRPNKQELNKDKAARQALIRMDEILTAERPYNMIKEIEGLISTVQGVNENLVKKQQAYAAAELEKKIVKVAETLDEFKANPDQRNQALKPLQDIKKQIQKTQSIETLFYLQENKANVEFEDSLAIAETSREEKGGYQKPQKSTKFIQASSSSPKTYLETEEDVDEFLEKLKKELLSAIQNNERIRIK